MLALLTILSACTTPSPPVAEPAREACVDSPVRYAIAANANGQGVHIYTATGDFLVACRAPCATPADYDTAEVTRRMAAARPHHTVNKALLVSEVAPEIEAAVVSAMTEDPAHQTEGVPTRLFDVVLGETACMADLQSRILEPPRPPQ